MAEKFTLYKAPVIWQTNFAGVKTQYNPTGRRNFNIVLEDHDFAEFLLKEKWNPKLKEGYEEGDPPFWVLNIRLNYETSPYPPRVVKISEDGLRRVELDGKTIKMLDLLRIRWVDVLVNPYHWEMNGRDGYTAYLESMYAVTEENPLDIHWEEVAIKSKIEAGLGEEDGLMDPSEEGPF